MAKPVVRLHVPDLLSPSGYAELARGLVRSLYARGWDFQLDEVFWDPNIMPLEEDFREIYAQIKARGSGLTPQISLRFQLPDQFTPDPNLPNAIYTMFETDGIPLDWVNRLNHPWLDQVWVPSQFHVRTFARSGVAPGKIRILRAGLDFKRLEKPFRLRQHTRKAILGGEKAKDSKIKTLFVASMQGQPRKNPGGLIVPFLKEFEGRDDVALLIKCYGVPGMVEKIQFIRKQEISGNPLPLILINEDILPEEKNHELLLCGDAYVSQSFGEGADLAALKCAAMGLPIIVPAWSGFLEYVDPNAVLSIPIAAMGDAHNQGVVTDRYYRGQLWAQPNQDFYRRALQAVVEGDRGAKEDTLQVKNRVRANHSLEALGEDASILLESLLPRRVDPLPVPPCENPDLVPRKVTLEEDNSITDHRSLKLGTFAPVSVISMVPSPSLPCGIYDVSQAMREPLSALVQEFLIAQTPEQVFQMIENHCMNLVHLQLEYGFFHPSRLRKFLATLTYEYSVPVVVTMHSFAPGAPHNEVVDDFASAIIFHNPEAAKIFESLRQTRRADPPALYYSPLPFPGPWTQGKIRKAPASMGSMIGFMGFSFAHKGLREWCFAMNTLRGAGYKAQGVAVAPIHPTPNPSSMELQVWAKAAGIERVSIIHQFLPEETLFRTLAGCHLIVLPYHETPWWGGSAAIRTVSRLGIPILHTRSKFFQDIPDGATFTMDPAMVDFPESFADSMLEALEASDQERAARVENFKAFAAENSYENQAVYLNALYQDILGGEHVRRRLGEKAAGRILSASAAAEEGS